MDLIEHVPNFNSGEIKYFDLQNFISYQKPDFMKFHGRYLKSFLVYEILPFLPFYKVIVVDNLECCTFTCVDTRKFTVNRLTPYLLLFFATKHKSF